MKTTGTPPPAGAAPGDGLVGRTLGDFIVRERLGEGGAGAVYLAEQPMLGREAVIKVLLANNRDNPHIVQRFLREARLASKLDHPYAAHIYAFGAEPDGLLWLAMELVRGSALDRVLAAQGPMPLARFLPLLERLCEVLHTAHEQGIVHRDIKPANVMMLSRAGRLLPKLLDLGIAKLKEAQAPEALPTPLPPTPLDGLETLSHALSGSAASGAAIDTLELTQQQQGVVGSPHFMAPEQWSSVATLDRRADIYSLGVLAYQCLTGKLPFEGASLHALARKHLTQAPPSLGEAYPPALSDVLQRAMAKKPEQRFETALAFATAVRAASGLGDEPINLPQLPPELQEALVSTAPQPLAEGVTLLEAARSVRQATAAMRALLATFARYLGVLALSVRSSRAAPARGDSAEVLRLLATLREQELTGAQWLSLAVELSRPHLASRFSHPLPALVTLLLGAEGNPPPALAWLSRALEEEPGDGPDEAQRAWVGEAISELSKLSTDLSFLFEHALVTCQQGVLERWMGLRRPRRARVEVVGLELSEGEVLLLDADDSPVLRLSPLLQALPPTPGASAELFFLAGRGRYGAKLVALPLGYERHDDQLWGWLHQAFPALPADDTSQISEERPPFRGLSSFTSEDRDSFFGREREAEAFANRLRAQSMLAVVGPSGVGKSSFVQAGVLPLLPPQWRALTVRPGPAPLEALALRLQQAASAPDVAFPRVTTASALKGELLAGEDALGTRLVQLGAQRGETLVLVIDQFEELVTLCHDAEERRLYADALVRASADLDRPVRLVLTLRDDFLIRVQQLPALRERIAPGLQLLGTPSPEDLLRILTEPLRRAGYAFQDPELPRQMVAEVQEQSGALALLSFTATQLWELRDRHFKRLTRKAYETLGGVGGALAHHAEATLAQMSEAERPLVREAFRHLVSASGTRAVLTRSELGELLGKDLRSERVLEELIGSRLLVASEGAEGADRVEVIHEALLSSWPRLVTWQREDAESARMREQLRAAARQWDERGRAKGVLWRGEALLEFQLWRARNKGAMTDLVAAFTRASLQEEARGRRLRRGALGFAFLSLLAGLLVLYRANVRAEASAVRAEKSATQTQQSIARLRQEQGRLLYLGGRPMQALPYLARALEEGADGAGLRYLLARTLAAHTELGSSQASPATLLVLAQSPDRRLLATCGDDHLVRLWDARLGQYVAALAGHTDTPNHAQFDATGTRLVSTSDDGTARVWAVPSGNLELVLTTGPSVISAAAFNADGSLLATAGHDKRARVWDARTGKLVRELSGAEEELGVVAFSPDGALLAAATGSTMAKSRIDGAVQLWRTRDGASLGPLRGHDRPVLTLAFDKAGAHLLTSSWDRTAKVWDVKTRRVERTLAGHVAAVQTAVYAPDEATIATTSYDGTARLWDTRTGTLRATLSGHDGPVRDGAFSPDGHTFATAGEDATARLWDASSGRPLMRYVGHLESIAGLGFSADGTQLFTIGDSTLKRWSTTSRLRAVTLEGGDTLNYAELTPDGKRLRGASDGRLLKEWDPATGKQLSRLELPPGVLSNPSWSPDGQQVAVEGRPEANAPQVWSYPAGRELQTLVGHTARVTGVLLGARGQALTFSDDRTARLWDAATGVVRHLLPLPDTAFCGAFRPDGAQVATTTNIDPSISIWDTSSGRRVRVLRGHARGTIVPVFSPSGRQLLSVGVDKTARLWDVATGRELRVMRGHREFIFTAAFSPDERLVVTGSVDGTARVWDALTGDSLDVLGVGEPLTAVAFTPDGRRVLATAIGADSGLWDATLERRSPEALLALVRCQSRLRLEGEQLVAVTSRPEGCAANDP